MAIVILISQIIDTHLIAMHAIFPKLKNYLEMLEGNELKTKKKKLENSK
jgi:hypothetical protein